MPPARRDVFTATLVAVQEAISSGVTRRTARTKDSHWKAWLSFCSDFHIDPYLDYHDPIPYLQTFAQLYRDGTCSPSKRPVRASTVANALCSVGQAFLRMGRRDPRLPAHTPGSGIDFRLRRQHASWNKADPPPTRVRPIPITLVSFLLDLAHHSPTASPSEVALADMICLGFFFLLRPGEYTGTEHDDAAFRLDDVRLHIGQRRLDLVSAPLRDIKAATWVSLFFTTQKNQRKGDAIALGRSRHPLCCPVQCAIRFILRHRRFALSRGRPLSLTTKLATYYRGNRQFPIRATEITAQLRFAATACRPTTGLNPADISARSLRAGGAMALLVGNVDTDTIKLLGRWHSDAMCRYLHQDSLGVMRRLSSLMLQHGDYNFLSASTPTHPPIRPQLPPAPPQAQQPAPAARTTTPVSPGPDTAPAPAPLATATGVRRSRRQRGLQPPTADAAALPRQLRPWGHWTPSHPR